MPMNQFVTYVLPVVGIMVGVPSMAGFLNSLADRIPVASGGSRRWRQADWTAAFVFTAAVMIFLSSVVGASSSHQGLDQFSEVIVYSTTFYWIIAGIAEGLHRRLFVGL
jgi:hypothetical protein